MNFRLWFAAALLLALPCAHLAQASAINGSFSIDGSITVSLNTITWTDNSNVHDMYVVGPPNPTGSWATMALNSEGTIGDLNLAAQPVGGTFPAFDDPLWMTFPGVGPQSTITIDLQYIFAGTKGTAECGAAPAPNQECTPLAGNGQPGPFNLENSADGTTSTAFFTFEGTAVDSSGTLTSSLVIGQFSSNFTTPYQTVLADLANNGSVTNTFAATFTAQPVPEPGTMALLGLGLVLVSTVVRRCVKN